MSQLSITNYQWLMVTGCWLLVTGSQFIIVNTFILYSNKNPAHPVILSDFFFFCHKAHKYLPQWQHYTAIKSSSVQIIFSPINIKL